MHSSPSSHSNPSSEAGSISSPGQAPQGHGHQGHQYKKSLSSKADPNSALNGDQSMAQIGSVSTFSLRSMQHTDRDGQVITDPDLSNPTRHRLERPLDTIRSFEASIDRHRRENIM